MGDVRAEREEVLCEVAGALLKLVGSEVTASLQAPDGCTLVVLGGELERGVELPWRGEEALGLMVGSGSVLIRAGEVAEVDRWSFGVDGERYASVCVYLRDGSSVLINQDIPIGESG
jgi:hypothetical protein